MNSQTHFANLTVKATLLNHNELFGLQLSQRGDAVTAQSNYEQRQREVSENTLTLLLEDEQTTRGLQRSLHTHAADEQY